LIGFAPVILLVMMVNAARLVDDGERRRGELPVLQHFLHQAGHGVERAARRRGRDDLDITGRLPLRVRADAERCAKSERDDLDRSWEADDFLLA